MRNALRLACGFADSDLGAQAACFLDGHHLEAAIHSFEPFSVILPGYPQTSRSSHSARSLCAMKAPNCSGVPVCSSSPCFMNASFISGVLTPRTIAVLRRAMMSVGTAAGTRTPFQPRRSVADHSRFVQGRHVREQRRALCAAHAECSQLAGQTSGAAPVTLG